MCGFAQMCCMHVIYKKTQRPGCSDLPRKLPNASHAPAADNLQPPAAYNAWSAKNGHIWHAAASKNLKTTTWRVFSAAPAGHKPSSPPQLYTCTCSLLHKHTTFHLNYRALPYTRCSRHTAATTSEDQHSSKHSGTPKESARNLWEHGEFMKTQKIHISALNKSMLVEKFKTPSVHGYITVRRDST